MLKWTQMNSQTSAETVSAARECTWPRMMWSTSTSTAAGSEYLGVCTGWDISEYITVRHPDVHNTRLTYYIHSAATSNYKLHTRYVHVCLYVYKPVTHWCINTSHQYRTGVCVTTRWLWSPQTGDVISVREMLKFTFHLKANTRYVDWDQFSRRGDRYGSLVT